MAYNKFKTGQFKRADWIPLSAPALLALSQQQDSPEAQIFFPAERKVFADPSIHWKILQSHIQYKN